MKNLKRWITLLTFLLTLVTIESSFGQENENVRSKFGLGVSLFNLVEYTNDYPTNSIYMTIELGSNFRLEPIVGFAYLEESGFYSFSIGAFGKKPISKFNLLYGLRIGFSSGNKQHVAPTIGGEYYFIKNFSIGSEVQLRVLFNNGDLFVLTGSSVIVRFYF
ncbi:MAG: hypothetical protein IH946_08220 [Bacteroidetes bacterium]|nr:hypothetical protein [Bacteroidota bacterium]